MRILITGASGLIGSSLVEYLHGKGHQIRCLKRDKTPGSTTIWNTKELSGEQQNHEPFEAVIHLAGENVADGRWSAAKKRRILNSRIDGTRELIEYLALLDTPPATFICASAIGYYGNRADEVLTEQSSSGNTFLAEVCRKWESEAQKANGFGARVVNLRFGMVLSPHGGALEKMLTPFKSGLGGPIGKGNQYMSWISIRDLTEIVHHVITTSTIEGPVNVVSPEPVTNKEFTRSLASVLGRPAKIPAPPFGLKLVFGEMADEMLLASSRVRPEKLIASGYTFLDPDLNMTLKYCVN